MHHLRISPATFRGIAIGLWVLSGLAFFADALLPHAGQFHVFAPWLLAASVAWTALMPAEHAGPQQGNQNILWLAGLLLACTISFVIIRDGTGRSFLFIAFSGLAALVLALPKRNPPRA